MIESEHFFSQNRLENRVAISKVFISMELLTEKLTDLFSLLKKHELLNF